MSGAHGRELLPRAPEELGIGLLFGAVLDAIIVSRSDGVIAFWNPTAEHMLGYTAQEARGMNVDNIVPPEFKGKHHEGIRRFQDTGRGNLIDARKPIEVPAIRKDGERIWVDLTLSRADHEGQLYAIAILRDVTDRVNARVKTEKAAKELHDAYGSLEAFSSVVAHDLKEPVRAMGIYLDEIQAEPNAAERERLVQRAVEAHHNLQRLLGGLLETSASLSVCRVASEPFAPRPGKQ